MRISQIDDGTQRKLFTSTHKYVQQNIDGATQDKNLSRDERKGAVGQYSPQRGTGAAK